MTYNNTRIINEKQITINGKSYLGLREVISKINKTTIKPRYLRPIHGDFTLENVLINSSGDIKLIDFDPENCSLAWAIPNIY